MGKQLLCAGPAELWIGFLKANTPAAQQGAASLVHLGWSEAGVYVEPEVAFEDCMTDLSGPRVPLDVQLCGQQCYISCDLKLFDPAILDQIRQRQNSGSQPGILAAGAIGSFMGQEGQGHRLLVHPPFLTKPSQANAVRPFNFPFAYLQSDKFDRYSATALKVPLVWRALNFFGPDGSATNYDQNEAGKGQVNFS